ncbi:hypothetical protein E2320_009252 [Naja naja]|nr:hypothetical protein E2320_009252 [Naja naja]
MKAEAREEWKTALLTSFNSRELAVPRIDTASHDWLLLTSRVFSCLYLRGIQLRGGMLPMRSRSAQGADCQTTDKSCRGACRALEMINHVLQVCEVTHDAQCAWHNHVVQCLDQFLRWQGLHPSVKPIITSGTSFITPDLLMEAMNQL